MNYAIIKVAIVVWAAILMFLTSSANAQILPKAEKIVEAYIKKAGGKKHLKSVQGGFSEWKFEHQNGDVGRKRMEWQSPALYRFETSFGQNSNSVEAVATNGNVAWKTDLQGNLQTMTDDEAKAFRLLAVLLSTRFVDLRNYQIGMQTVGNGEVAGEKTYLVEFSARNGAKMQVSFGVASKLPLKIESQKISYSACLGNYQVSEKGVLEAFQITEPCETAEKSTVYNLTKISYNANLNSKTFDPPQKLPDLDLPNFIADLYQSEQKMLEQIDQYSYEQNEIERTFDGNGKVKKEENRKYEVFPTKIGRRILKLVSENGVALTGEKLAKEEKQAGEKLVEAEEDFVRRQKQGKNQIKPERGGDNFERYAVLTILRIADIYSPRIEHFRNRETLVINFRPRPKFNPNGFIESIFSKMGGTIWIDKDEKQIIRLESRVMDNVSLGGFLGKFKKDSAVVFERTKFGEVWLPKLFQSNISARLLLVRSLDSASNISYDNYRRFNTEVKDSKVGDGEVSKPEGK